VSPRKPVLLIALVWITAAGLMALPWLWHPYAGFLAGRGSGLVTALAFTGGWLIRGRWRVT
jgi:hypothetical protein